jgi:chloramphenicol-sensitive protein RarD
MLAAAANIWWGMSPLFWKQFSHLESPTVVAQRIAWSFVLLVGVNTATNRWRSLIEVAKVPRNLAMATASAMLLFTNWIVFIWAIGHDRVTESALGYFLMPLVSVLLGRLVFGEKLRGVQWVSIAIVAGGVGWLTVEIGQLPLVALGLGFSFSTYGAIRKGAEFGALDGLSLEVAILVLPMIGYIIWLQLGDNPSFVSSTPGTTALFIVTSIVTTLPLITFARAVRLIPLAVAGLLQYLNPTIQFLVGVLIYNEAFEGGQVLGYVVIWAGLVIFATEAAQVNRSTR